MPNKQKKRDILDVNVNVAIAFGLALVSLLLTYWIFFK